MNKISKYIILLIIVLISSTLLSCKKEDHMFKFEVDIVDNKEVLLNTPFSIYVKTTNISSEDFHYEGSSTVVGAIIYLKKNNKIIRPTDVPVTKDFRKMVFESKSSIERTWNFEYELLTESGSYDLYIEFFDEKEVIKDFILV